MAAAEALETFPVERKVYYDPTKFITTTKHHNKVHRDNVEDTRTMLCGSQNIILQGKTIVEAGCIIRGDLANVKVGKFTRIGEGTVIRPGARVVPGKGEVMWNHITIEEHVIIGKNCIISASTIGKFVEIGDNCVIGRQCVLNSCCKIADNTVLAPGTEVPSFCEYSGTPGVVSGELPEGFKDIQKDKAKWVQVPLRHFPRKALLTDVQRAPPRSQVLLHEFRAPSTVNTVLYHSIGSRDSNCIQSRHTGPSLTSFCSSMRMEPATTHSGGLAGVPAPPTLRHRACLQRVGWWGGMGWASEVGLNTRQPGCHALLSSSIPSTAPTSFRC